MYLAKFDENGFRQETYLACEYTDEQKQDMLNNGYVELSEEDWNYYVGNIDSGENGTGYIRDKETGKPISAPPPAPPSKDVLIAQLDAQYVTDKDQLMKYYLEFSVINDTEGMESIKQELDNLAKQYDLDLAELEKE